MRPWRSARSAAVASLVLALCAAAPAADAEVAIPPVARVTDLTGTLTPEQKAALEQTLGALEASKGSQIAVLMLPSTAPEEIEAYSIRVASAWKLGRKGVDDGVVVVVAKDDRRFRVEVGKGLEGAITDLDASRIESEFLRPRFRAGDFYGGIKDGVDRLVALINGEPLPAPPPRRAARGGIPHGLLPILLIAGLFGAPILRALLGRPAGAAATGGIVGFIAWMITATMGIAAVAAIAAFLFTLIGGLGGGNRFGGGFGGLGGFGGGGFGGGGFGGGGGGGFSGGGGGFSGGGASGSW
jgi:uncharacterized protein